MDLMGKDLICYQEICAQRLLTMDSELSGMGGNPGKMLDSAKSLFAVGAFYTKDPIAKMKSIERQPTSLIGGIQEVKKGNQCLVRLQH